MIRFDDKSFEDICIGNITVLSGIRPSGRTIDHFAGGRKSHGILYIFSGQARFRQQNGRTVKATDGELLLLPKGLKYKMQYTAESTTFVLIDLEIFDKKGIDRGFSEEIELLARDDCSHRIARIMADLELCATAQSLTAVFRRKELVFRLLRIICEADSPFVLKNQGHPQILAGVLLLEQSFLENLPISRFAEACSISESSFRSLFGKQYGMSPIQYRNRLRIHRAAAMLSEGSCTISEAAYACGFENIGYFCRYYKKITGETPTQTKQRTS